MEYLSGATNTSIKEDNLIDQTDALGFLTSAVASITSPKKEKTEIQPPKVISIATEEEYYDSTNENRGFAIVFNHYSFKNMPQRNGTNRDRDRLEKILEKLNFNVRVHNDLTYIDILKELDAVKKTDHSKNDCLLVIVMSHGDDGVLYAKDQSYPVKELWEGLTGSNCPSLIGKPKLFLIQACRGDRLDSGSQYNSYDTTDSVAGSVTYNIPQMADLLVMYSTYEGHYSWRNPENGSWFIQALCEELEEYGQTRDLILILIGVSRRVAYSFQSNVPTKFYMDSMKQMPTIVSTLTKTLYFTRKVKNIKN